MRHYGFPKDALLFYNVHSDANDEHGDINEAILKKYCLTAEQQQAAFAAARFRSGESGDAPRYYLPILCAG